MRALACLPALLPSAAAAASEDAWATFARDVEAACLALVDLPGKAEIEVNPFGSASFGAAIVTVTAGTGTDRMICIHDKAAGTAELTAPFSR
ncbi:MAG: hypothetical protein N2422_07090 [Rhodobacteraceae bacterium]|nr:hypothetical protein [Paracoccaceae bacterium]